MASPLGDTLDPAPLLSLPWHTPHRGAAVFSKIEYLLASGCGAIARRKSPDTSFQSMLEAALNECSSPRYNRSQKPL